MCNIITRLSGVTANSLLPVIYNRKPGINDNPLGGGRPQLAAQTVRTTLRGAERLSTMHEHTETHYSIFAHKQGRQEKKRQNYAFRRQFIEKPSIIPGCPVAGQKKNLTCGKVLCVEP